MSLINTDVFLRSKTADFVILGIIAALILHVHSDSCVNVELILLHALTLSSGFFMHFLPDSIIVSSFSAGF